MTVAAGQTATVNLSLSTSAIELEGIVAVGYGTVQRRDVTGSVASVDAEEIQQIPTPNLGEALKGRVSGLDVQTTAYRPGASEPFTFSRCSPYALPQAELGADIHPLGPEPALVLVRPPRHASEPEPSPPSPPPGFIDSQISLHSGQTGNFSGSRPGVHFLPHSARTGLPDSADCRIFSFFT